MANKYVRSGAAGTASGADWANAYLTLAAALSGAAAGDDLWVSEDHAESNGSAQTLTSPGTSATPCRILCADHAGSVPPVAADLRTTGTVTVTGAFSITFGGVAYCYGLTFSAGNSTNAGTIIYATNAFWVHDTVTLSLPATSGISAVRVPNVSDLAVWKNVTVNIGAGSSGLRVTGALIWEGGSVTGTAPTTLFDTVTTGVLRARGVDFSLMSTGKNIYSSAPNASANLRFENCKFDSAVTKGTFAGAYAADIDFVRCDSSGTNYKFERQGYLGSEVAETTVVRTGGATDGTTQVSKKIVTSANSKWQQPLRCIEMGDWIDSSGSSKTVTVEGTWGGGAAPNNDDIWMEIEYLGDASSPKSSFASSGKATTLTAGSAYSTSVASWGGGTTNFAMSVSFTPQQKGPIAIRVYAAKASTTFYIDPKATIV